MKNNCKIWQRSKTNAKNKENEGNTVLGRRKPKKQKKIQNLSQKKSKNISQPLLNCMQLLIIASNTDDDTNKKNLQILAMYTDFMALVAGFKHLILVA